MNTMPPPLPPEDAPERACVPTVPPCGENPCSGTMPSAVADATMPPTYFGWLLVCILLCVVTAIVGLVFSSKVSARWRMGDIEGARRASADARLMLIASVVLGLINVPFIMLYYALT